MHMSMMVKGPAVQTSCYNTFYRLLPMIYNSNQQLIIIAVQGLFIGAVVGGGEGALTSRWILK
jgi:hypothetical protein